MLIYLCFRLVLEGICISVRQAISLGQFKKIEKRRKQK